MDNRFATLLDKHAPLETKSIRAKPPNLWFTPASSELKSARRHIERIWFHTRSSHDLKLSKSPHTEPSHMPTNLTFFTPATEEEILSSLYPSHLTLSATLILYLLLF